MFGQAERQGRFEYRVFRDQHGIVDGIFLVRLRIGNDRGDRRFATRSRGGGDSKQRREFFADLERAFHLGNGLIGTNHFASNAFCAIHRGTASERDDALAIVFFVEGVRFFDVADRRVGNGLVVDDVFDPFFFQSRLQTLDEFSDVVEIIIGNDDDRVESFFSDDVGQFVQAVDDLGFTEIHDRDADFHNFLDESVRAFGKCVHR